VAQSCPIGSRAVLLDRSELAGPDGSHQLVPIFLAQGNTVLAFSYSDAVIEYLDRGASTARRTKTQDFIGFLHTISLLSASPMLAFVLKTITASGAWEFDGNLIR
jgi:hypothetical protein